MSPDIKQTHHQHQQPLKDKTMHINKRSPFNRVWFAPLIVLVIALGLPSNLEGKQNANVGPVTGMPILGKIEYIFLDDPTDPWSKGTIVVEGVPVTIPRNILIDLPANRLTLAQLYEQAPPACLANNETGLAMMDACLDGREGAYAQILANRTGDGHLIAGDVFIARASTGEIAGALVPTTLGGFVSYIDYTDGYMVVNGIMGEKPREAGGPANNQGVIVRINDPEGVHTIQQGLGCDGGPNCSPDPRFTNDPGSYTIVSSNGYPMCIPSTVTGVGGRTIGVNPDGTGDPFCPATNRVLAGVNNLEVPDSRLFAPFLLGDDVGGEGHWTSVNGVRFFSAYSWGIANKINTRRTPDQPDYLIMAEAEWDAPGFQNERNKSLFIGFSTLDASDVELFAMHVDPQTGQAHEVILASAGPTNLDTIFAGEPPHAGGIFKVGFDIDFIKGAPVVAGSSACQNLLNAGYNVCPLGGTMDEEFAIVAPVSREVIARSRHHTVIEDHNRPKNVRGQIASHGEYVIGVGIGHPEFVEIDLDRAETSFIFAGVTWNLDRRLGPGGCEDADTDGACDSNLPLGALGLDPFPFSGLDPRLQATLPGFTKDRVFAHYPFGENDFVQWPPQTLAGPGDMNFAFASPPSNRCQIPNEAPTANPDTRSTSEDVALQISEAALISNDTDLDEDLLTCYQLDQSSEKGGDVSVNAGVITYIPPLHFNGTDSFGYGINDGHGATSRAIVTIEVAPTNDAPVANDDHFTTALDTTLSIEESSLLINDTDLDGDSLSVLSISETGSAGGTLALGGTGWVYTPPLAASGIDSFSYTITDSDDTASATIFIYVGNGAPQALADTATTDEDVPALIDVLANDTDPDMDTLSVASFTQAPNGSVSQSGQQLIYTPNTEFFGLDQFTYTATDGKGTFSTSTVTLTINFINDPPITHADFAQTLEDTVVIIDVLANDVDPENEALTVSLNPTLPGGGFEALSVTVINNQIRYEPLPDLAIVVPDSITYVVSDGVNQVPGQLAVSVLPVNDPPVAILDIVTTLEDHPVTLNPLINDFDIENDTLQIGTVEAPVNFPATVSFTTSSVTITPDPDFADDSGSLSLTYTVGDGRDTSTGAIVLLVVPENDAPTATDDPNNTTQEDTPVVINVLANDLDVDGDTLLVTSVSDGLLGTATLIGSGSVLYIPATNASGIDQFQYSITDNQGGVSTATVTVDITPTEDSPLAADDGPISSPEDTPRLIASGLLLSNDSEPDGQALTLTGVSVPANGTATLVGGDIEYTPALHFSGTDSFIYTVSDTSGLTATATVTMNITPVNDAPVASDDFFVMDQDTTANFALLANDADADSDALTITTILNTLTLGSAVIEPNQTITYTPGAGLFGTEEIIYEVSDGNGGVATRYCDHFWSAK